MWRIKRFTLLCKLFCLSFHPLFGISLSKIRPAALPHHRCINGIKNDALWFGFCNVRELKFALLFPGSQVEEQKHFNHIMKTMWVSEGDGAMKSTGPADMMRETSRTPALGLVTQAPLSFTLKLYPNTCCHGDALG